MRIVRFSRRNCGIATRCLLVVAALLATGSVASAQTCPEESPLKHYTGGQMTPCLCFLQGEEAGALLEAPAEHYPIEVLRVGIGWTSTFGGNPQSIEQAVHIYNAGLPDPGTRISSLLGPTLTDGQINEFDFEPFPGTVVVDPGPFAVTLEFLNTNAGVTFASSIAYDGDGCQPGKNAVFALPGGWLDACLVGVTGDWVVYAIYRRVDCPSAGVEEELVASGGSVLFISPRPNPFSHETSLSFVLARGGYVDLSVYDVRGRHVTTVASGMFSAGLHTSGWSGTKADGSRMPSGVYFARIKAGGFSKTRRVILNR